MIALPEVEREDHDKRQHNMQQKKEYDKGSGIHTFFLTLYKTHTRARCTEMFACYCSTTRTAVIPYPEPLESANASPDTL
jgi:hypothetical protein